MTETGRSGRNANPGIRELWETAERLAPVPAGGTWVPWRAIEVRDELMPRARLDQDAVESYKPIIDELPPIEVQRDTFVLIDGWHRLRATSEGHRDHVRIVEVDVSDRDLFRRAIEANVGHGVALKQSERLAAARRLVKMSDALEAGERLSDAEIARVCGINRSTIVQWRAEARWREQAQDDKGAESDPNDGNRQSVEDSDHLPRWERTARSAPPPIQTTLPAASGPAPSIPSAGLSATQRPTRYAPPSTRGAVPKPSRAESHNVPVSQLDIVNGMRDQLVELRDWMREADAAEASDYQRQGIADLERAVASLVTVSEQVLEECARLTREPAA